MISKETFIKTMERLENLNKRMEAADNAMHDLCEDFGSFYICDAFNITTNLLSEIFNDKENDWLGYFIWESDWLHNFELGDITINDEPVEINNWEDVYDFLVSCMEEQYVQFLRKFEGKPPKSQCKCNGIRDRCNLSPKYQCEDD